MVRSRTLTLLVASAVVLGGAILVAACSPLAIVNASVPSTTYRVEKDIAFGPNARDRLDVYRPAAANGPAPVVIFFYGGNWASGDRADYLFVGEALASKGFVTVIPDYRLYPEVRFPEFLNDSARAVRWAQDHVAEMGGDPAKIFLMGHSAGAYNAATLALNPEYLRAAGVDVARIRGLIGLAGPYDFRPFRDEITRNVFSSVGETAETQPIHFVSSAAPPTLLITGDADTVVSPGNSVRLSARLREQGVPVQEIVYPGAGHRKLVGALAAHLRLLIPVRDDVAAFITGTSQRERPN
ncbi:MAG: alpha/beta hydrolase [Betaproteobacteria bacterium]